MPPLTPEQQLAVSTRDVSVALSAGAGCGKTFVLTERFLSHLDPQGDPAELSSLVAITFTDRAAREMRERVRKACRDRLAACPESQVEYWQKLVRDLDAARISTIHSFCLTLLRSHAVEARIDPQARLFDETTGAAFLQQSLTTTLHDLLIARDPDAVALFKSFGWEGTLDLLGRLIPQRYRLKLGDWLGYSPEALAAFWQEAWQRDAVPLLLKQAAESPAARRVVDLLQTNVPSDSVMAARRATLLAELPALAAAKAPLEAIESLVEAAAVRGGGTKKNWDSEEIYNDVRDALASLRAELKRLAEKLEIDAGSASESAVISLAALRAVDRAGATYDQTKRDEGWLDFDDLLIAARDLLREHPEVCRRAAAGISLLMVDEFQDTDRLQAEIVRLLCGDRLTRGKLFLVGDIKQSIYRFRRAEPEVFRKLRQELPKPGRLPLTGNFRSQPAVLHFVNALCDGALGGEYEPLVPQTPQVSTVPCIEFLFASVDGEPFAHGTAPGGSGDKEKVDALRQREANWIARRLRLLLTDSPPCVRERLPEGGYQLRPAQPRDIVILFRAMSDVRYYEEALRELGIDHYVVGGRAFYAQQEIYDVVNLCRTLDDPDDLVALVGLLRSPFFSLSDDELYEAFSQGLGDPGAPRPQGQVAPDDLTKEPKAARALSTISRLRGQSARCSLSELLQAAIDCTGYDAALLTEFLGERKLANLRKLVDLAREFDRAGVFHLGDFAAHLTTAVAEESRESLAATHPESSNVVRLMTIHQSKGLEFPVVVLADMNRQSRTEGSDPLFDEVLGPLVTPPGRFGERSVHLGRAIYKVREAQEELDETQRLLYVATTRAVDLLILSASIPQGNGGPEYKHPWLHLLRERFDLDTGQPRLGPGTGSVSVLAKYSQVIPEIRIHQTRPEPPPLSPDLQPRSLPLSRLREAVEAAAPARLPDSLRDFSTAEGQFDRCSVSQLESLVAEQLTALKRDDLEMLLPLVSVRLIEPQTAAGPSGVTGDEATRLGTLVHKALELLDVDPEPAIERAIAAETVPVPDNLQSLARQCLAKFCESELFETLRTTPRTYREIDFLMPWPPAMPVGDSAAKRRRQRLITGQIDALIPGENGWAILDYKTGHPGTRVEIARDAIRKYAVQLGVYCYAVADLTGCLPEVLELVFLPSVTRLQITPTPAFLARISSLINEALDTD